MFKFQSGSEPRLLKSIYGECHPLRWRSRPPKIQHVIPHDRDINSAIGKIFREEGNSCQSRFTDGLHRRWCLAGRVNVNVGPVRILGEFLRLIWTSSWSLFLFAYRSCVRVAPRSFVALLLRTLKRLVKDYLGNLNFSCCNPSKNCKAVPAASEHLGLVQISTFWNMCPGGNLETTSSASRLSTFTPQDQACGMTRGTVISTISSYHP